MIAQYTPEEARRLEDAFCCGYLKQRANSKLPRPFNPSGHHQKLMARAEQKRLFILSKVTGDWQKTNDVAKQVDLPNASVRSSIDTLIRTERLEAKKERGKIYVRLPQGSR